MDASPEWEDTSLARLWSRGGGAGGHGNGLLLAVGGLVEHTVAHWAEITSPLESVPVAHQALGESA